MAKPEFTRTYETFEDACRDQDEHEIAAKMPTVIREFEQLLATVARIEQS